MASNKDFAVKLATNAALQNKPAPVYKPATSYVVKEAARAAYETALRNSSSSKR